MTHSRCWTAAPLLLIGLASSTAAQAPSIEPTAAAIIKRAVDANTRIARFRADMEQVDVVPVAAGVSPLTAAQTKSYATFVRRPQPDGSTVLYDRVDGTYEVALPSRMWMVLRRVGGDGHVNIGMVADSLHYRFLTRYPDSIALQVTPSGSGTGGVFSIFASLAKDFTDEIARARSVTYRGRDVSRGVLCDVIEVELPDGGAKAPFVAAGDSARNRYSIGVADGLFRRVFAASAATDGSGHAHYRETTLTVDPSLTSVDVSWDRYAAAVREARPGKPLPKVVTTRKSSRPR